MNNMRIWVDGDSCPVPCKEVLFKTAERRQVPLVVVANRFISVPPESQFICNMVVPCTFNAADTAIYHKVLEDEIVITLDFGLIRGVLKKGAHVVNPRGETYMANSINAYGHKGAARMADVYHHQLVARKHEPFSVRDKTQFANALDRLLTKMMQQR